MDCSDKFQAWRGGSIKVLCLIYSTPVGFTVDFGAGGLGNQSSTATYDGVFQLANTPTAGVSVPAYTFHRLLGDANGDNVVDEIGRAHV